MKDDAKKRSRAVALLSGGLDSTVAAALAAETFRLVRGLFYDYGQHAARREYAAAGRVAERYGIPLERIDLPWMGRFSESVLIEGKGEPPDPSSRAER